MYLIISILVLVILDFLLSFLHLVFIFSALFQLLKTNSNNTTLIIKQ